MLRRFLSSEQGSLVAATALVAPILMGGALFTVSHAIETKDSQNLQQAADKAAIAASRQLALGTGSESEANMRAGMLTSIAESVALQEMRVGKDRLTVTAKQTDDVTVFVELDFAANSPWLQIVGASKNLHAEASAEIFGTKNICLIALQTGDSKRGIELRDSAVFDAGDCGLYSNSEAPASISALDSSVLKAPLICAAGGYRGGESNVGEGSLVTDCPQIRDPLDGVKIEAPSTDDCNGPDNERLIISGEGLGTNPPIVTLDPGFYCGGITIEKGARVFMQPGEYYIKAGIGAINVVATGLTGMFTGTTDKSGEEADSAGALIVQDDSSLSGEDVAIIATSKFSNIVFKDDADINLSARKEGPLAGLLISSVSSCGSLPLPCHPRKLHITSGSVRNLLGTIYMPEDNVEIDTTNDIGKESAFTIIIARQFFGQSAPRLYLNTDYDATDVPVPSGIIGDTGIRLKN